MFTIARLTPAELASAAPELGGLLVDTVADGHSLGFLHPLDPAEATAWWRALGPDLGAGGVLLWTARADTDGRLVGTVQLRPAQTANGRHRAEVAKLMVDPAARGQRLGKRLLAVLEETAAARGIRLLVLDTATGSPAEGFYATSGWTPAGSVPDYAADPAGELHATTIFYKALAPREPAAG
ncbi:N-acetyltransferase family protein [Kitasatospora sp. NPDC054939]